jgi:glycerol-1-phosphate dehydrogenase [NAD(P)+]
MHHEDILARAKADFICSCGQRHSTDINRIAIGRDLVGPLAALVAELASGPAKVLFVADENTWRAAGAAIQKDLCQADISCRSVVFPAEPPLVPDEKAVFAVVNALEADVCLLVAVGSGTLNDLTRFVSHRVNKPYAIVATAPSMDGYASSVAALIINNMKQTLYAWGAAAILADPAVLAACPQVMIAAGLGDIVGKYSAVCDWRLGGLIESEYTCDTVATLVLDTVEQCRRQAPQAALRDEEAVAGIFEALIMTGITMSYVGNSRPASGSEHHLSHFWEMAFQREGLPPVLHGSKVGLATIMTCALYRALPALKPDFARARELAGLFDQSAWEAEMKAVYAEGADVIIQLEQTARKHDPQNVRRNLAHIESAWDQICDLARQMPEPADIRDVLRTVGGADRPSALGISRELVESSLRHAMEMRDRYTVLRLFADLGLDDLAVSLVEDFITST